MPIPDSTPVASDAAIAAAPANLVQARPNWPFLLVSNPVDWEVVSLGGKHVMVPVLRPGVMQPGVNMVRTRDKHEADSVAVKDCTRYFEGRGWTVLPLSMQVAAIHLPKGIPPGKYLRELPCRLQEHDEPGKLYIDAWSIPISTPKDEEQEFIRAEEEYAAWRAFLVSSGLIPQPAETVRKRLVTTKVRHLKRRQATPYADAELKRDLIASSKAAVKAAETAEIPKEATA